MAIFTTKALSGITATGATGGGYYSASTNSDFSAYGVAWNTSPSPTIANPHTVNGSGTGETFNWTSILTGLTPNTLYYVRAYVTPSTGATAYAGGIVTGKTLATQISLTTLAISGVTNTTATSGGRVTGITGGTVTSVGIRVITGGTGYTTFTGTYLGLNVPFVIPMTGLLPVTSYNAIAYAVTTGNVTNLDSALPFVTAPNAPHVGSIIQPISSNETGSVIFTNLPNHSNTLRWSGTATGITSTIFTTGVTITGLTVGTYLFSIKTNLSPYYSPVTTVTIESASVIPTEFTSDGYDLYYKTGIGDGPALAAYLVWLDEQSVIHEEP
jgi:hypothetical protein